MMTVRKLERTEWRTFFDRLSKTLKDSRAEIEIGSLALGQQVQANWLPLIGLAYDLKDDTVEVALEGLDHLIERPRDFFLDEDGGAVSSLEIIDADNARQIIKFKEPISLASN
jgi:hypothetical protein